MDHFLSNLQRRFQIEFKKFYRNLYLIEKSEEGFVFCLKSLFLKVTINTTTRQGNIFTYNVFVHCLSQVIYKLPRKLVEKSVKNMYTYYETQYKNGLEKSITRRVTNKSLLIIYCGMLILLKSLISKLISSTAQTNYTDLQK